MRYRVSSSRSVRWPLNILSAARATEPMRGAFPPKVEWRMDSGLNFAVRVILDSL